mmetsp:Transcript_59365/g.176287  ORF Transcript_59365/g.176287 Transcript_59365/m.176287 type:complete len:207 (+) Transcript_59365:1675-2295(+)
MLCATAPRNETRDQCGTPLLWRACKPVEMGVKASSATWRRDDGRGEVDCSADHHPCEFSVFTFKLWFLQVHQDPASEVQHARPTDSYAKHPPDACQGRAQRQLVMVWHRSKPEGGEAARHQRKRHQPQGGDRVLCSKLGALILHQRADCRGAKWECIRAPPQSRANRCGHPQEHHSRTNHQCNRCAAGKRSDASLTIDDSGAVGLA